MIKCGACHTPTLHAGFSSIEAISNMEFHPYTDLLLHDMGPGLADSMPEFLASGSEWRTAPLWGIGLTKVVGDQAWERAYQSGKTDMLLDDFLQEKAHGKIRKIQKIQTSVLKSADATFKAF